MNIKKYVIEEDYQRIKDFLVDCYYQNKNINCWLPARFEDLVYRLDVMYKEERKEHASQEFIYIWEDNHAIVGLLIPDGDSIHINLKNSYEFLFCQILDLAEEKLKPLFKKKANGKIDFLVISHDSQTYKTKELLKRGYSRSDECEYDNRQNPMDNESPLLLPIGFKQIYGEEIADDRKKALACYLGFNPNEEKRLENFNGKIQNYKARKTAPMFKDSFESLIITEDNSICAYSFCYVDKITNTGFIEPVTTREKYRRKGLGKAMLQGIINRLKEEKITMCYVNSYGTWRKSFYNNAGFETIDSMGYWYKEI